MTPDGIRIEVNGVPRAQPRGRHVGGRVVSTTGPAVRWRALVREATLKAIEDATADGVRLPLTGPVEFVMEVRFPTPDSRRWEQWRTATRNVDFDNALKLAADVLVNAGVMGDDGQIARSLYEAKWAPPTMCGAVVLVRQLEPREAARIDAGGLSAPPEWLGQPLAAAEYVDKETAP